MNRLMSASDQPSASEHGTTMSYIIGFVLSLGLTLLSYRLVVDRSYQSTPLLVIILGLAILQMAVQLFFFLHLGRGPKPLYNLVFFASTAGIIVVVVTGSLFIMNHLYHNMSPAEVSKQLAEGEGIYQVEGEQTGACYGNHARHKITIQDGQAKPSYVEAHHCDGLIFINKDRAVRKVTFGTHPYHGTYAGEDELTVRKGRSKMIILNQSGTYQFHDHLDPAVTGSFTVSP